MLSVVRKAVEKEIDSRRQARVDRLSKSRLDYDEYVTIQASLSELSDLQIALNSVFRELSERLNDDDDDDE